MNERLRNERLRRGWSQTRLSALTGIASPDLSALERGRRRAYPGWRKRLALVFGLPEAALFSEPELVARTVACVVRRARDEAQS